MFGYDESRMIDRARYEGEKVGSHIREIHMNAACAGLQDDKLEAAAIRARIALLKGSCRVQEQAILMGCPADAMDQVVDAFHAGFNETYGEPAEGTA
ncbi:hypothetical protein FKB34_11390 [Glycocaulis profundi]|nr:hypothetical protein FKB34_11390 [Glycocaulis profundi]